MLPGGYAVGWTGMLVLKHDGSQHHGVGILRTVPVSPTRAGIEFRRRNLRRHRIDESLLSVGHRRAQVGDEGFLPDVVLDRVHDEAALRVPHAALPRDPREGLAAAHVAPPALQLVIEVVSQVEPQGVRAGRVPEHHQRGILGQRL